MNEKELIENLGRRIIIDFNKHFLEYKKSDELLKNIPINELDSFKNHCFNFFQHGALVSSKLFIEMVGNNIDFAKDIESDYEM